MNTAPAKPDDEFSPLGKIKILVAVMIVGFGAYAAYWAQEPVAEVAPHLKADVSQASDPAPTPPAADVQQNADAQQNNVAVDNNNAVDPNVNLADQNKLKISIVNFQFDPASLKIEKGQTVEWTNNDTVPHTVTADNFTSQTLNPGETFDYTFDQDGKFEYHCSFHPQMKAEILVGNVAANQVSPDAAAQNADASASQDPASSLKPSADAAVSDSSNLTPPSDIPTDLKPAAVDYSYLDQASTNSQSQLLASTTESTKVDPLSTSTGKIIRSTRIPSSGPEDVVYVAALAGILYMNRKKLLGSLKN